MAIGRFMVVAIAALVGGCMFFVTPVRSGLTASVAGVVSMADIHKITTDYYAGWEWMWTEHGSRKGQLLHVRLSTRRDLVSFSARKDLVVSLRWRFCDDPRQEVNLGGSEAFINGVAVWTLEWMRSTPAPTQSVSYPALEGSGRFVYDAILYVRDRRPEKERRIEAFGVVEEAFDLEREPRDVCVRVRMKTVPGGYRTRVARIPKEEIAAALSVDAPFAPSPEMEAAQ